MKRSPLSRKTVLNRTSSLSRRPKAVVNRTDPTRVAWKTPRAGWCANCSRYTLHLHRHHCVYEQHLRAEGRADVLYDMRNALDLCERCHSAHHSAMRRLPLAVVPQLAREFGVEVLGEDAAILYFARYYSSGRTGGTDLCRGAKQ